MYMNMEQFDATAGCWTGQALPDAKGLRFFFVYALILSLGYWCGSNFTKIPPKMDAWNTNMIFGGSLKEPFWEPTTGFRQWTFEMKR